MQRVERGRDATVGEAREQSLAVLGAVEREAALPGTPEQVEHGLAAHEVRRQRPAARRRAAEEAGAKAPLADAGHALFGRITRLLRRIVDLTAFGDLATLGMARFNAIVRDPLGNLVEAVAPE